MNSISRKKKKIKVLFFGFQAEDTFGNADGNWTELVECLYHHNAKVLNISTITDLVMVRNRSTLAILTYSALACLIPGLLFVILGSCIRRTTRIDEDQ